MQLWGFIKVNEHKPLILRHKKRSPLRFPFRLHLLSITSLCVFNQRKSCKSRARRQKDPRKVALNKHFRGNNQCSYRPAPQSDKQRFALFVLNYKETVSAIGCELIFNYVQHISQFSLPLPFSRRNVVKVWSHFQASCSSRIAFTCSTKGSISLNMTSAIMFQLIPS